ncbi:MAG: hypothetical protein GWN18_18750, partial [Thermoplasmata archaeon]|nr:hypothetical protein [Thermoplasmata archaeon]NIS14169.1 hypothetical protein [Thermoplasmata archaeon]NIS22008.1 hypothetical protein [Thermoplasmata archaeon]NIT79867.1 hypothetical protein [Thermoplasmata archaeon]NIU51032.1 hypothetical protein [Thermoplasmata archaeon]
NPSAHGVNGIQVRSDGVMRVLSGSTVSHVPTGFKYEWLVHTGGALETDAAEVRGAGWNPSSPGLIIMSSDNTVNGTLFSECYTGLTVQGDSNTV